LSHVAEHGDEEQRARARAALETSSHLRGERLAVGELLSTTAIAPGEKRRTIYDGQTKRALPGKLVRGEGSPATKDVAVNEAYDGAGSTYDFYSRVLDRNSIDNRGMRLDSTVHFGSHYSNAQWNGRQMVYGDGDGRLFNRFTSALEVIGHELTHGVTQYTAALDYNDESGALNEHFSDVFGTLVKQYTLKQSASRADWLVGAGLLAKGVHGVAVRSMKAPGTAYDDPVLGKDPQPATMRNFVKTQEDNGGVHINCGIPNHAFYRVAILLGGKAWEVAGRIWYRTLTVELKRNASFLDCANATVKVARDMYGEASPAYHAVAEGWAAVGISVRRAVAPSGTRIQIADAYMPPMGGAEVPPAMAAPRMKRPRT
ncbi:MAG: M4 family metallopeptidase, partial [Thermoanaerobaculia bacterium]